MFCTKCGKEIPDNTVCDCEQQAQQQPQQQQPQQPVQPPQQQFQQQPQQPQQQQFQQQPPPQQQQFQQPQQPQQPQQQQFQQQPPPQQQQYQQPQQPPQQQYQQNPYYGAPAVPADNRKLYCILSYIGILWLIGMFAKEKTDPRVRFHVGQGMILSICLIGISIVSGIIFAILGAVFGTRVFYVTYTPAWIIWVNWLLQLAVYGVYVFLAVTSILNINKNQDKPLPIIGGFAFYK